MRDESYEAGYRAGHLQGWRDALAKVAQDQVVPSQPSQPAFLVQGHFVQPATTAGQQFAQPATSAGQQFVQPSTTAGQQFAQPAPSAGRPSVPPPAVVRQGIPRETPAQQRERRARRDRQNINITLYVASLLLVAAAALFIGTGLSSTLRFAGVGAVTALFYATGLILHARVPRLKPAAVAFAGTGLALIPVSGLALFNFAWSDGPAVWLLTSVVGTVAYAVAALRLDSKVLAYLSLTFVVSSAWSGAAVLGAALVWYFVALIGVSVLLTALSLLRPSWLPPLYVKPLADLHPFVVPAVAVAVNAFPLFISGAEYALVMGLCGVYFGVAAMVPASRARVLNYLAARAALSIAAAVGVTEVTGRATDGLFAVSVLLGLQALAVAFTAGRLSVWFPLPAPRTEQGKAPSPTPASKEWESTRWRFDALGTYAAQFLAVAALGAVTGIRHIDGLALGGVPLWVALVLVLLTGMVLAAKLLNEAEFAPHVALVLAGLLVAPAGEWALAGMLAAAAGYWLVRRRTAPSMALMMDLSARLAVTAAVPVIAAAMITGSPQPAVVWSSLLAAAVAQQVLTVMMLRRSLPALAPNASLAGLTGLGVATCVVLIAEGPAWVATAGMLVQLVVVLACGLLLVVRPTGSLEWQASIAEVLPLVVAGLLIAVALVALTPEAGLFGLLLLTCYLLLTAVRMPRLMHRWSYWWLGRLGGTLFLLLAHAEYVPDLLAPETALVLVLALQLPFPLIAAIRGTAPQAVVVDGGILIALQLVGCALLAPLRVGTWEPLAVLLAAAASAMAAGYLLRERRGTEWFAPVAFLALGAASLGSMPLIEILLGGFGAFAAVMVVAAPHALRKGWYFVVARISAAALALVFTYDAGASPAIVSLTFASVLAAQHVLRWLMRRRLVEVPFQQAAVWITLAGQAVLPVAFAWRYGGAGDAADAGRWVLLVEWLLLLLSAVVARRLFAARGALFFGVGAILGAVLALSPLVRLAPAPFLDHAGTVVLLLLLGLAACAARVAGRQHFAGDLQVAGAERWLWLAAAGTYSLVGLVLAPWGADWLVGTAVLVVATVSFTVSHVERIPVLYPVAVLATLVGALLVTNVLFGSTAVGPVMGSNWNRYAPWLAGPGLAAAGLLAARWLRESAYRDDPIRRWSLAGGALVGLTMVAGAGLWRDATSWTAAIVVAAAVVVAVLEVPAPSRRIALEIGAVVVVAALQRATIFRVDEATGLRMENLPDPFWVLQWYVLLAGVLAGLRYVSSQRRLGRIYLAVAAGLLTLSGLGILAGGGGGAGGSQLWVLVLLACLLVAGLLVSDRVFAWWGALGVAACVLWSLREYTFALLALIAVGLISFAVWRLNRGTGSEAEQKDRPPSSP
ncbi:hypothetical protein [Arthrobacter ulcerisalmonis]|uniref:hypothetical protein n=4 Tax=Arthrobacter ulcerisalmonis TaxID=2483813 RepID=UPI0036261E2A